MKNYRTVRIVLALLTFLALNSAFLDISEWGVKTCGWIAKWQFAPALLSLNMAVVTAWLAFTLVCGRHYCSIFCPLGVYQDIVARLTHRKANKPYRPTTAWTKTRLTILVVSVALTVAGFLNVACLVEPYGTYGRIATELFAPIYTGLNNALASIAASRDSYAFGYVPLRPHSIAVLCLALIAWSGVTIAAWKGGRWYCNAICPVGTTLGYLNTISLNKVTLTDKCKACHQCESLCKAGCIDITNKTVDSSRCVLCGRCWQICKFEGIKYGKR